MNCTKLLIVSSVALGTLGVAARPAQAQMHGTTGFHSHGTGARPGMIGGGFGDRGHDFGRHRFRHFNDFVFFDFGFPFYPYPFYYPGSYYPYSYYGYDPYGYYPPPQYQGYGGYQGYGVRGSVVVEVQRRLAASGYYRGPIDGVIGTSTRRAIRAYQRSHGLRADGVLSRRFLATMGLA